MAKKKNNNNDNNNNSNVVEKKEGGENKKGGDGGGKKQENKPIPVVLKVEMHCEGCVSTILKHARAFEGVESVEAEATSNKLTVIGKVDPLKIRDYLHYKTKKKVELISPQPQKQDTTANNKDDKKSNDKKPDSDAKPKEAPVITAVLKLGLHCQGCIEKIEKIVSKTKGVHESVIDKQKELVTVKGTMDVKALTETLKSRLKRPVDIVPPKKEKEGGKDGENVAGGGGGKKKGGGGNGGQDGGGGGGGAAAAPAAAAAAPAAAAAKMEENRMEYMVQPGFGSGYGYVGQPIHGNGYVVQPIHGNGYVGHPVYAPYGPGYGYGYGYGHGPVQGYPDHLRFNDENPNACSIM